MPNVSEIKASMIKPDWDLNELLNSNYLKFKTVLQLETARKLCFKTSICF